MHKSRTWFDGNSHALLTIIRPLEKVSKHEKNVEKVKVPEPLFYTWTCLIYTLNKALAEQGIKVERDYITGLKFSSKVPCILGLDKKFQALFLQRAIQINEFVIIYLPLVKNLKNVAKERVFVNGEWVIRRKA